MAEPFDLVIFDCDGVLIDSEPLAAQVEADLLRNLGWALTPQEVSERFSGVSLSKMYRTIEKTLNKPLPTGFPDHHVNSIVSRFDQDLASFPGLPEFLQSLNSHTCVATNSPIDWVSKGLSAVGLWTAFEGRVFTGEQVEKPKPAPDLFLLAATHFETPPSRCLVIEDSIHGVRAAQAARMTCIGFTGGGHCREGHADNLLQAGAANAFESYSDLSKHLIRGS